MHERCSIPHDMLGWFVVWLYASNLRRTFGDRLQCNNTATQSSSRSEYLRRCRGWTQRSSLPVSCLMRNHKQEVQQTLFHSSRFCNAYFTCEDEVGTPGICRDGLWFDEDRQECAHAMDAYCPHGLVPPTTPTPDVCRGVEDGRLVASPDSCNVYYVCANEIGYRAYCPPDQYFDEERQMCDDQEDVVCLI